MKVKEVIRSLQRYNQDEDIVAMWWSKADFTEENNPISVELWVKAVESYYEDSSGEDDDMVKNSIYESLWEYDWVQADTAIDIMFDEVNWILNNRKEIKWKHRKS